MKQQSSVRNQQDPVLLLFCSPARLHSDCSVLCLRGRQQPLNLILQLSLLNFLLAPLPFCIAFVLGSDVTHFHPGQAHRMQLTRLRWSMRKSILHTRCRTGTQQSLVRAAFLVPAGQCQAWPGPGPGRVPCQWAARDLQSSFQPTLLRARD